jgi:transposase-like protein
MPEIILTCSGCKTKQSIRPFFYDITTYRCEDEFTGHKYSKARVKAKWLCPDCGTENQERFENEISKQDIIAIAIGKRGDRDVD